MRARVALRGKERRNDRVLALWPETQAESSHQPPRLVLPSGSSRLPRAPRASAAMNGALPTHPTGSARVWSLTGCGVTVGPFPAVKRRVWSLTGCDGSPVPWRVRERVRAFSSSGRTPSPPLRAPCSRGRLPRRRPSPHPSRTVDYQGVNGGFQGLLL